MKIGRKGLPGLLVVFALCLVAALPTAAQDNACADTAVNLLDAGDYAAAADQFACALEAEPDNTAFHQGVITAYLLDGRYFDATQALAPLRAVFTSDDGSIFLSNWAADLETGRTPENMALRAFLLWATAQDTAAAPVYDDLMGMGTGIPAEIGQVLALSSLVYTGEITGDAMSSAALAVDTSNPQVFTFLADTLRFAGTAEALDAFTEAALERFPDDSVVLTQRARVLAELDRSDEAVALLQQVEALNPDSTDVSYFLALADAYAYAGDVENTQAAVDRALELGSDTANTLYALITANERAGDRASAAAAALDYVNLSRSITLRRDLGDANDGPWVFTMREGLVLELTFEAAEDVPYTFTVNSVVEGEVDPLIILLDSEGNPIDFNDDYDADNLDYNAWLDGVTLEAGTYTLIVAHAGLGTSGAIEVQIAIF